MLSFTSRNFQIVLIHTCYRSERKDWNAERWIVGFIKRLRVTRLYCSYIFDDARDAPVMRNIEC